MSGSKRFSNPLAGEYRQFKDHLRERRLFNSRALHCLGILFLILGVLIYRYAGLQVTQYHKFITQSDRNRLQVRPISPNRGLIFDAEGRPVAENRAVNTLMLTLERIDDLEQTINRISGLIEITEREHQNFKKAIKLRRRPFQSVPLKFDLTEEELAVLAVNEYQFDGVDIQGHLVRTYPYANTYTHVGGYVGRVNAKELESFDDKQTANYSGTNSIGKVGLEKFYESVLHGKVGQETIETDVRGRIIRVVDRVNPVPGEDLHLFLDFDIQQKAFEQMGERRGSVVAINIQTGGVLAMVSTPSYDPNLFVTGISNKQYDALNYSLDLPLFNRSIQAQYPAGSTIKPVLGLAGLEDGVIKESTSIYDPGFYRLENDNRIYRDWKRTGHGSRVNFWQAIVESCDVYFYDLGFKLGVDKMHSFGKYFGLGEKTNIDIPSERSGLWPSRAWKRLVKGLPWYPGNSLNMSIGQGDVLVTPLQLASMTSTIARKGTFIEPRIVNTIGRDTTVYTNDTIIRSVYNGEDKNWTLLFKSMVDTVHNRRGTAYSISEGLDFKIAGKTGTAQVVGIGQDKEYDSDGLSERNRDHALFIGFAPAENPTIAVAVIIENGEKSSQAALVAREVMKTYLYKQKNKKVTNKQELSYAR